MSWRLYLSHITKSRVRCGTKAGEISLFGRQSKVPTNERSFLLPLKHPVLYDSCLPRLWKHSIYSSIACNLFEDGNLSQCCFCSPVFFIVSATQWISDPSIMDEWMNKGDNLPMSVSWYVAEPGWKWNILTACQVLFTAEPGASGRSSERTSWRSFHQESQFLSFLWRLIFHSILK